MAEYKLNTTLDTNKVFLVNRSELEGRIDPSVYSNYFQFISNLFDNNKLSDIAYINPSTNLLSLSNDDDISFIQMDAIDEHLGNLKYIETKKVSDKLGFTRFKENDLIWAKITPCMQNGKSAIVRNTINGFALGSTEFFIIRPKNKEIKVEYLHFLLRDKRVLKTAMKYFGGSAGQQRVSKDFLLNFNVPVPPIIIQEEIVSIINNAYTQKQTKEAEALALLASIDTYLLDDLGVTLPEKDNSLQTRIFITKFSKVSGGRLDPIFFNSNLKLFFTGQYEMIRLKTIILSFKSGLGAGKNAQTDEELGIIQIRPTNIGEYGELKFEKNVYLPKDFKSDKLEVNDVLFNNTNSQELVGKTSILKNKKELFYSNHITVLKTNKEFLDPDYLCYILNLFQKNKIFYSICTNWNNQSGVGLELLRNLEIPLPQLEKQNELVIHIQEICQRARVLQDEAKQVLEQAIQQVEQIILG